MQGILPTVAYEYLPAHFCREPSATAYEWSGSRERILREGIGGCELELLSPRSSHPKGLGSAAEGQGPFARGVTVVPPSMMTSCADGEDDPVEIMVASPGRRAAASL